MLFHKLMTGSYTTFDMVQVEWDPYDRNDVRDLNMAPHVHNEGAMVIEYANGLYYVVEHHLPQRVMKQFDRKQNFPLQHETTSHQLHE
jgi:hypothetical protein